MRQRAQLGMALFLLSQAIFFFMLITALIYFRDVDVRAAPAILRLNTAAIYTACLLASSFTMWRAVHTGERLWLGITIVLGAIFLAGQGSECLRLFHSYVMITQNLFSTTFFTLTGLHGLHLLAGLVLLAIVLRLGEPIPVAVAALYWYFVAAVWIAIFSVAYLRTFL